MTDSIWLALMSVVYPSFKVEVENNLNQDSEGCIDVEVEVILNERISENLRYAFTRRELIEEEENPIKEDLFYAMVFAGMEIANADTIIYDIILVATDCISAEGYSINDKLTISLSVIANSRNEDIATVPSRVNQSSVENVEIPVPARNEIVQSLQTILYEEDYGTPEECVICLKKYLRGSELIILGCGHKFGKICILKWLSNSNRCPLCRYKL